MKINKDNFGWIFTTIALALLLALSVYLGITGWYYKTEISYTTDMQLGKTVQMSVKKNESNSISFNLEGSYLSGEKLPQKISIKNIDNEGEVFLRAKIFIYSGENQTLKMNLDETANWVFDDTDGYYYFNDSLIAQNKVTLCSNIIVDKNTELKSYTKYIVTIVVEAIDTEQNPIALWGKNPKNI